MMKKALDQFYRERRLRSQIRAMLACEHGGSFTKEVEKEGHSATGRSLPTLKQIQLVLRKLNAELEARIAEEEARENDEPLLTQEENRIEAGHSDKIQTTSLKHMRYMRQMVTSLLFRLQRVTNVDLYRGNLAMQQLKTDTQAYVSFTHDLDEVIAYADKNDILHPNAKKTISELKEVVKTSNLEAMTHDRLSPALL